MSDSILFVLQARVTCPIDAFDELCHDHSLLHSQVLGEPDNRNSVYAKTLLASRILPICLNEAQVVHRR
jgi:hypothetical protein